MEIYKVIKLNSCYKYNEIQCICKILVYKYRQ